MKIKTKLKTVFAIALATFCVGSTQAKQVWLSVADWPDREMRNSLKAIEIKTKCGSERYEEMLLKILEENGWRFREEDFVDFCAVRVEMDPDGRFNYSAVSLDEGWKVESDGDVISGEVNFDDVIEIPAPARRAHAVTWDARSANATVEVRAKIPDQDIRSNFESGTSFPRERRLILP